MQLSIHFIYLHMTPQAAMLKFLPCLKRFKEVLCYTELARISVLNISPHILNMLGLHMVIKLDLQFDTIM